MRVFCLVVRRAVAGIGLGMVLFAGAASASSSGDVVMRALQAAAAGSGPALQVSPARLAAARRCYPATADIPRDGPVLLIHGTGLTAEESWRPSYVPALAAAGYDVCTVDLPRRALDDAQISAEYAVAAVRAMFTRYGAPVNIVTHSQGALEARWAIRFWPDIRYRVDDLVMLSGSNHGTATADVVCLQRLAGCTESVAQQRPSSRFLAALNAGDETPGAIDYTSIYSYTDEIVITALPDPSPALDGATNIAVQTICPGRPVQHIPMITDAVSFALARDALDHDGPAEPARIAPATVCTRIAGRGLTPVDVLINGATYLPAGASIVLSKGQPEPALQPYAAARTK